jgi:hypothetical protein
MGWRKRIVLLKPIPNKCIWCLKESPEVTFSSESHVFPECVGNDVQQVLTKGIVCDKCNQYFGSKVEPMLIDDPVFKSIMGVLQERDTEKIFTFDNIQSSDVDRDVTYHVVTIPNKITVYIKHIIKRQIGKADETRYITQEKEYDQHKLALLSRAVHKLAYETLAYMLFVGTGTINTNENDIEVFGNEFDAIRKWARYGQPIKTNRPFVRFYNIDENRSKEELYSITYHLCNFNNWLRMEMDLCGDCYIVNLTSPSNIAYDKIMELDLRNIKRPYCIIGDKIQSFSS